MADDKTAKGTDNKTMDESIKEERCAISVSASHDLHALGRVAGKTHCEMNELAVNEYIARAKAKQECMDGTIKNEHICKCLNDT